jgi:hypothetical protein
LLRGGAGHFRIVGLEQQSPDRDEIAGCRRGCFANLGRWGASMVAVVAPLVMCPVVGGVVSGWRPF